MATKKKPGPNKKTGRKPVYEKWIKGAGLTKIKGWARNGLSDEQIANNIGIARTTIYEWKKRFPDFADALAEEKEVADLQVENALYKRALGYEYEEVKIKTDRQGEEITRTIKSVPPDVTAQKFWLVNRQRDQWRDKIDSEITGKDGEALNVVLNIARPSE